MAIKREANPQLAESLGLEWLGTPDQRSHLLQNSDFVVIAASASGIDRPFNADDFQQMRSTAYLVNVARGAWVDELALVRALQLDWIAGAGLDVFAQEPLDSRSPLLQENLNLILTPHLGGRTDTGYAGIVRAIAKNIQLVSQGKLPANLINP